MWPPGMELESHKCEIFRWSRPRPVLSPYVPSTYDDRFFWIDPCTLGKVCYNIHMNENETLEDYDWDQDQYDDCAIDACWDL